MYNTNKYPAKIKALAIKFKYKPNVNIYLIQINASAK